MRRLILLCPAVIALGFLAACGDTAGSGATSGTGGTGGSTAAGGSSGGSSGGMAGTGTGAAAGSGGSLDVRPDKPAGLVSYVTGEDADKDVTPTGPGVILMGGGTDVDAAFTWWKPYLQGGDVVVLRTSGADGYNSYLYTDIGGCDSVETLLVTTPALAADPYVAWTIRHAEGIFLAGGDQATYLKTWKDTPVEQAIMDAYARGAVVGGTSAGCAVLGELMFAAYNDTVYSDEALADPYNKYMTMERDFLAMPLLKGVIMDTHFVTRDRMGRLVTFLGRLVKDGWSPSPLGIGVDEATAIVAGPDGKGKVLGSGAAYVVRSNGLPTTCEAGKPLDYAGLTYSKLILGDAVTLPAVDTVSLATPLSASGGALTPAAPY
jgi:cyanophycinase